MCHCTPEIRTPCCGKFDCHPKDGGRQPFQIRMMEEKLDIHCNMVKLRKFIESDKFNEVNEREKPLLKKQLEGMEMYYGSLNHRVYFHTVGKWPDEN